MRQLKSAQSLEADVWWASRHVPRILKDPLEVLADLADENDATATIRQNQSSYVVPGEGRE